MAGLRPLPLAVRDPVRFHLDTIHNYVTKRLVKVFELGTTGQIPPKKAKSYELGIKVGLAILERTAPVNQPTVNVLAPGSVTLQLVQPDLRAPDPQLPPDGVTLHLGRAERNGA